MLRNYNSELVKFQRLAKLTQSNAQDPGPSQPPAPSSSQFTPAPAPALITTPAPNYNNEKNPRATNRKLVKKQYQSKLQAANTAHAPICFLPIAQETITKQEALDNLTQVLKDCNQQPHPILSVAYNLLGIVYHRLGITETSNSLLQEALTYHQKALEIDLLLAAHYPIYLQTASMTNNYIAAVTSDLGNLADALCQKNFGIPAFVKPISKKAPTINKKSGLKKEHLRKQEPHSTVGALLNFQQQPIKIAVENNSTSQPVRRPSAQGFFDGSSSRKLESRTNHLTGTYTPSYAKR